MLLDPSRFRRDDTGRSLAFFCLDETVVVHQALISALVEEAGDRAARICLHASPDASFHEMIILEHCGNYFPPHRHPMKGESLHIISGELAVMTYDDAGAVTMRTVLGRNGVIIARIGMAQWHSVLPLSETAIYHEAKPGPFLGMGDREFAPWASVARDLIFTNAIAVV
jgi:cupin fold WbuC family metalloprotein